MAGEEYQLSTLPETTFCPSSCNNLNMCTLLHRESLQSTILLLLTKCKLQVADQVSLQLCYHVNFRGQRVVGVELRHLAGQPGGGGD